MNLLSAKQFISNAMVFVSTVGEHISKPDQLLIFLGVSWFFWWNRNCGNLLSNGRRFLLSSYSKLKTSFCEKLRWNVHCHPYAYTIKKCFSANGFIILCLRDFSTALYYLFSKQIHSVLGRKKAELVRLRFHSINAN